MFDFKNKKVIVTGGSHGIGKEIAAQFYNAGAFVSICSRNEEDIYKTAYEIGNSERIYGAVADMSDLSSLKSFFKNSIERLGGLDIFINNAGVQFPKSSLKVTEVDLDKTIDTNLKGYFFNAQLAANFMVKNKICGSIINIGSVNAVTVVKGQEI